MSLSREEIAATVEKLRGYFEKTRVGFPLPPEEERLWAANRDGAADLLELMRSDDPERRRLVQERMDALDGAPHHAGSGYYELQLMVRLWLRLEGR